MAERGYEPFAGHAVSGTPGTGTITLGSALTGHEAITSAMDGLELVYTISYPADDANENVNVLCKGTYTHSGTTLTRTNLEGETSHSATSTAEIRIFGVSSDDVRALNHAAMGYIALQDEPITVTESAGTATVTVKGPFKAMVDGRLLTASGDTGNGGESVSGTDFYNIYIWDNSGLTVGISTTDPSWDDDRQGYYWNDAGTQKRCIGGFIVTAGALEDTAKYLKVGEREISYQGFHASLWISVTGKHDDWYEQSLANLVPIGCFLVYIGFSIGTSGSDPAIGLSGFDMGSDGWFMGQFYGQIEATSADKDLVNTGTIHVMGRSVFYKTSDTNVETSGVLKRCTYRV